MLVHPAAIAAQPLGNVFGGIIEGAVRIGGFALAAQGQAPSGMQVDVAGEKTARPAERHVRLQRVIEILACDGIQMLGDARPQRV
jgi:hypothetical protein